MRKDLKMPLLNILIVPNNTEESKALELISKSKYLNKLYSTAQTKDAIEIRFNTFKELAQKCKALKIDIVVVENEKWILQGIADVLRKNFVNCIALTSSANKLILSGGYAKESVEKYGILTPKKLSYPSNYPVVVRADGVCRIGNSLEEIIEIRKDIAGRSEEIASTIFLEEFLNGQRIDIISLFDGKNLLSFSNNSVILEYSQKLCKFLTAEKFEFIGFLTSKLVLHEEKIYHIGFSPDFSKLNIDLDFLYLLNSAIYQKLNEIKV